MSSDQSPIILAFSGGLDTSFCVPWLKETYGRDVITATIDTGGIDSKTAGDLEQRALALGAIEHIRVDARESFFDDVIRHLIAGNVLRGNAYPLCVGAERGVQAEACARVDQIVDRAVRDAREGDVILVMSNGAFDNIWEKLLVALDSGLSTQGAGWADAGSEPSA